MLLAVHVDDPWDLDARVDCIRVLDITAGALVSRHELIAARRREEFVVPDDRSHVLPARHDPELALLEPIDRGVAEQPLPHLDRVGAIGLPLVNPNWDRGRWNIERTHIGLS
jgi:hypothetical protein